MEKTHDFTKIHWGQEFALDVPPESFQGNATGQSTLKSGDHIILCIQCRVDEVQYYCNEPDLWQARISFEKPISLETITENNPLQPVQSLMAHFRNSLHQFSERMKPKSIKVSQPFDPSSAAAKADQIIV
jgi:hypothetical protein